MGSLNVVLIAVIIYCSGAYCNTPSATIAKSKDTGFVDRNNTHAFDEGTVWKNFGLPRPKSTELEEPRTLDNASTEANKRKSRLLGSLAFLTGLSLGGLATAASSTVKNIAKLPQASFSLNLGPSKTSPYLAAYYNPYSSLPYPLFYPGPLGLVPVIDPTKPQTTSQNDLTPQVISVFDNREPINLSNEDYVDEEKKFINGRRTSNNRNGADGHAESRGEADRNAEEKTMIRGCQGGQRRHGSFLKGSAREREEDLQVDADDLRATLNLQVFNTTIGPNQTVTDNTTMPMTTSPPRVQTTENMMNHYYPNYPTARPFFPGYFGGYPQNVNHVDLTSGSDAYRYGHNYGPIHYNPPYEQPANFHHADKYNAYPSPHVNAHFAGPFSADQTNEYANPDLDRLYHSEYQPPYAEHGFRPVK